MVVCHLKFRVLGVAFFLQRSIKNSIILRIILYKRRRFEKGRLCYGYLMGMLWVCYGTISRIPAKCPLFVSSHSRKTVVCHWSLVVRMEGYKKTEQYCSVKCTIIKIYYFNSWPLASYVRPLLSMRTWSFLRTLRALQGAAGVYISSPKSPLPGTEYTQV